MKWQTINKNSDLLNLINILISGKSDIRVIIDKQKKSFTSKIINIPSNNNPGEEKHNELIIERLDQDQGNDIIQTASQIHIVFSFGNKLYKCLTKHIGINSTPPFQGHIIQFPDSFHVEDTRRDERHTYDSPEFVSAEFRIPKQNKLFFKKLIAEAHWPCSILLWKKAYCKSWRENMETKYLVWFRQT